MKQIEFHITVSKLDIELAKRLYEIFTVILEKLGAVIESGGCNYVQEEQKTPEHG